MVTVSIGVPVYNGGDRLRACLQCLQDQTFKDFEVLIHDNASTDTTGEISREFIEKDSRFRYFCQTENRGPFANFISTLDAAQGKYFFWRAHDDLSDLNFIEVLLRLLETNPAACLAAPRVFATNADASKTRESPATHITGSTRLGRLREILRQSNPSWLYGLWHRDIITKIIHETFAAYPYAWASDHLMLFSPIIDEKIVTTNETTFIQLTHTPQERVRALSGDMAAMRRAYIARCRSEAALRDFSFIERIQMHRLIRNHASDRCYGLRKIFRRRLGELVRGEPRHSDNQN